MNLNSTSISAFVIGTLRAVGAGALGGLLSFFVGEGFNSFFDTGVISGDDITSWTQAIIQAVLGSAGWAGVIGLTIGLVLLISDNIGGLRGQWHRDVLWGVPLFFGLSFAGGAAGQIAYSLVHTSLTRGIGWSLMGWAVGMGIGKLRRDRAQARRGALGGALGGFAGGYIFNSLTLISSAGNGSFSRLVGQILMGALIGLLMRIVQEALKDAVLLGVSAGPYEGKEYPLNNPHVTVGRAQTNDISLFREEMAPLQLGALVFGSGVWHWQGEAVNINGQLQSSAPLASGDTLQLGATNFRFYSRSAKNPVSAAAPIAAPSNFVFTPFSSSGSTPAPPFPGASPSPSPAPHAVPPPLPVRVPPPIPTSIPTPAPAASPSLWPRKAAPPPVSATARAWALELEDGQMLHLLDGGEAAGVGRAVGNTFVLEDSGVSSNHARLQVAAGALSVCDLSSTNGTFVNDFKIPPQTPHPLRNGDRVRFGKTLATVRAA